MFGKNKKDKLKEKIEKQKQELKKMEGAKMQFEIKDGSIKKQDELKTENVPEASNLFDGAIKTVPPTVPPTVQPTVQSIVPQVKGPEQTSQEQEMLIEQQRQHMAAIEQQQREQVMTNQQEQLRQEQERMMRGPPINKSQPIGPIPTAPVNTSQEGTLGLTIFLTEKETIEKMQIPVVELATLTDALDKSIVEQTAFRIGGLTINGLYIKRYLVE